MTSTRSAMASGSTAQQERVKLRRLLPWNQGTPGWGEQRRGVDVDDTKSIRSVDTSNRGHGAPFTSTYRAAQVVHHLVRNVHQAQEAILDQQRHIAGSLQCPGSPSSR